MNENSSIEYDQLTGLHTRWYQYVELQQIIESGENRVFVTIDVDNFKLVNATYGTKAGDRLLQSIALALAQVYPDASICRVSGDEFAYILSPTRYSRYQMSMMTRSLFDQLHQLRIQQDDGSTAHPHLSFSIGSVFIDPAHHTSPDIIYHEARESRLDAKRHEGNYLSSHYGCIPDVEGAFLILREDRQLYNSISDRLFRIHDQADWIEYLREGAQLKGDLYRRNQSQLDDILLYYQTGDLPDFEYEQLFQIVVQYASSLDAVMFDMFIAGILLPYYEQQDSTDASVREHLGHLYLLLSDALIAVYRMGHRQQVGRIVGYLRSCLAVTRDLPHGSDGFEPHFFALCEIVGNFESLEGALFSVRDLDGYYDELRELLTGAEPVVLTDSKLLEYFEPLVRNASLYPLYRAAYLSMLGSSLSAHHRAELARHKDYICAHLIDGVYDLTAGVSNYRRIAGFLQHLIFDEGGVDRRLDSLTTALQTIHSIGYGIESRSNLVFVTYLFLAAAQALVRCSLPMNRRRYLACHGILYLLDILRKRKTLSSDSQLLFLTRVLVRAMISSPALTSADKYHFLELTMASVMIDTYSHSKAVAAYARVILTNIVEHHPALLVGEGRPYASVKEVQRHRQSLLDFMDAACMLHDIGKMNLSPITSNAYRRLTSHEFQLIRRHPEAGVALLHSEPAFDVFRPFIYSHHRWWNGEDGYPASSSGTQHSPLQVLVDILSMCDSLEAATSRIGRNYRSAKSFMQILDEFYVESGTRYSSEVLHSIISSPDTYYTLRQMVDVRWQDVYRKIFEQVVHISDETLVTSPSTTLPDLYGGEAHQAVVSDSPFYSLPVPAWMRQMDRRDLQLHVLSLTERNRLSVEVNNFIIFIYDVAHDSMSLVFRDEAGGVSHKTLPHFSERSTHQFISAESYQRVLDTIRRILSEPGYPRQGFFKVESLHRNFSLALYYSCVTDDADRVLSITGHLEDNQTTRSRLLETIHQQNTYVEMIHGLVSSYMITIFTDVELTGYKLIKGYPQFEEAAKSFSSTRELIAFASRRFVDAEFRDGFLAFCDPATLAIRIQGRQRLDFEYHSSVSGWIKASILPACYDARSNITHVIFCTECIDEEHRERVDLSYAAHHDALTGLYNRLRGEELIAERIRQGGTQVFAILDCDNFKRINDQLSHLVGDKVLREVGHALCEFFPDQPVMRLGGDEFVIHIGGEKALRLVNSFNGLQDFFKRLAQRFAAIRIPELENIPPTFSCGVVFTDGSVDNLTFEELYDPADHALRQSKKFRNGTVTISEFRYRDYFH